MKDHVMRNFQPNNPANQEEIGDVVRIEERKDGKWGVAIRMTTATKSVACSVAQCAFVPFMGTYAGSLYNLSQVAISTFNLSSIKVAGWNVEYRRFSLATLRRTIHSDSAFIWGYPVHAGIVDYF